MPHRTITVVGLGYLGSVTAVHLAETGHEVVGIDVDEAVRDVRGWFSRYNDIESYIDDSHIERITTSTDYADVAGDVSIIGVNTPAREGSADLSNIRSALRDLAAQIEPGHTIILRSTLPPGACRTDLIPLVEETSGLTYGDDLHVCYAPEFMRGGAGIADLKEPSKTVLAGDETGKNVFRDLFPVPGNVHETSIETAEAVKCFDNVFHGLKISLANESGRLGIELDFDPRTVMDIITSDDRLNISDMYLDPGNAYGGPCLSKDITILRSEAESSDAETPVLSAINESNDAHNDWIAGIARKQGAETVGIVGAAYKEGFNSTVNSPALAVAERLGAAGTDVLVHDPSVTVDGFPQVDLATLADRTDLVIIFNRLDGTDAALDSYPGDVIDLTDFSFDLSG